MRRLASTPRPDWQKKVEEVGLTWHTGEQAYWNEAAFYEFTAKEVDVLEAATNELEKMTLQAAQHIIDNKLYARMGIPEIAIPLIEGSWEAEPPSLYGRFDFAYDGVIPPKLLEYNADTPTSLVEAAVVQWYWLQELYPKHDQFNSLHERLIAGWKALLAPTNTSHPTRRKVHFAGMLDNPEDAGTLAYLADTATQAGAITRLMAMDAIGRTPKGGFVDADDAPIEIAFKLYPWEWMFREQFGTSLLGASTRWIEPPWKAILSSKGILPLLWEMFEGHPNLLPAYFADDPRRATLGDSYVMKPLHSREGANVKIVIAGNVVDFDEGPYGDEPMILQAVAPLPVFDGNYTVLGSWIAGGVPAGLSVREDNGPITKNASRFLPHAIIE